MRPDPESSPMATLPLSLPRLAPPVGGTKPAASAATRHRLLVIDDDPGVLSALGGLFRALGVDVETCSDPVKALDLFARGRFDLVISDERMPGMSGLDLVRRVRARSPGTPTILITAHADRRSFERAYASCGVFRYLTKPWDTCDLVLTVRDALRCVEALA